MVILTTIQIQTIVCLYRLRTLYEHIRLRGTSKEYLIGRSGENSRRLQSCSPYLRRELPWSKLHATTPSARRCPGGACCILLAKEYIVYKYDISNITMSSRYSNLAHWELSISDHFLLIFVYIHKRNL